MESKICTKCGRELPANLQYFFKNSKLKDGLATQCKECQGYKFQIDKNYEVINNIPNGFKYCNKCKSTYPATKEYFHKQTGTKDGLHATCKKCSKKYIKDNRSKITERNKEWLKNNPDMKKKYYKKNTIYMLKYKQKNTEKIKKYHQKYYSENKEKILRMSRLYYQNNKESHKEWWAKYKLLNHDKIRKARKLYYLSNKEKLDEYRKKNKEKIQVARMRRKKRLRNLPNTFTENDWMESLRFFDYKDAYTGLPMKVMSQDHVIPVSKGGGYVRQNIVPCEFNINASKQDMNMEQWYKKQPFFSEERLDKIYEWTGVKDNIQQLKII